MNFEKELQILKKNRISVSTKFIDLSPQKNPRPSTWPMVQIIVVKSIM
jgi:hypothetical protein